LLDQQPACWIDRRFIGSTAFLFAQIARVATVWIKIAAGEGHRSHPGSSPAARKLSAAGIEQWASSSGHRAVGIKQWASSSGHREAGIEKRASSWIRRLPRAKARQL
jgi:hypothetical protein